MSVVRRTKQLLSPTGLHFSCFSSCLNNGDTDVREHTRDTARGSPRGEWWKLDCCEVFVGHRSDVSVLQGRTHVAHLFGPVFGLKCCFNWGGVEDAAIHLMAANVDDPGYPEKTQRAKQDAEL